jgi:hypothetical protein
VDEPVGVSEQQRDAVEATGAWLARSSSFCSAASIRGAGDPTY